MQIDQMASRLNDWLSFEIQMSVHWETNESTSPASSCHKSLKVHSGPEPGDATYEVSDETRSTLVIVVTCGHSELS